MASKDLHNNIQVKMAIPPQIATDNTPFVSSIIDTFGYESCEFVIATGTLADANATFTTLFEDGDDSGLSDHAAVDDAFLLGTEAEASFQYDDDNEVRKIGYVGSKRYVRLTITPAGNSGNAPVSALALLGHPHVAPVVQAAS